MTPWDKIAERRMRKAELEGQFKGLAGEGKPLPYRPGDAYVSAGEAVGARVMAEAGVLPREITLKKQLLTLKDRLATETDPARRKQIMAELAKVQMHHEMEAEARRKFIRG